MNSDINSNSLLTFSPSVSPQSILKETCGENLMLLQTPTHKNLKVSFQTPARTPLGRITENIIQTKQGALKSSQSGEKWKDLRHLDDESNWKDRIEVITKYDHEDYKKFAKDILEDIVNTVVQTGSTVKKDPLSNKLQSAFEDVENEKENVIEGFKIPEPLKKSDNPFIPPQVPSALTNGNSQQPSIPSMENSNFDNIFATKKKSDIQKTPGVEINNKDFDQFNSISNGDIQTENSLGTVDLGEFQDATTLISTGFNFDYLESKGSVLTESEFRKQSLFLKFDPMFASENHSPPKRYGRKSDILDLCGLAVLPESTHQQAKEPEPKEAPDYLCDSPTEFISSETATNSHVGAVDEIIQVLEYSVQDLEKLLNDSRLPLESEVESLKCHLNEESTKKEILEICTKAGEEINDEMKKDYTKQKDEYLDKNNKLESENKRLEKQNLGMVKLNKELLKQSAEIKDLLENYKKKEILLHNEASTMKTKLIEFTEQNEKLKSSVEERDLKFNTKIQEEQTQLVADAKKDLISIKSRCKLLEIENKLLKSKLDRCLSEKKEIENICSGLAI